MSENEKLVCACCAETHADPPSYDAQLRACMVLEPTHVAPNEDEALDAFNAHNALRSVDIRGTSVIVRLWKALMYEDLLLKAQEEIWRRDEEMRREIRERQQQGARR